MPSYVYILGNKTAGTLYTGVTSNLIKRIAEHKQKIHKESFTSRYNVTRLVWYEMHTDIESAICRETQIKNWQRAWKIEIIEKTNPDWRDLYDKLTGAYLTTASTI
jgi:putative endonuclease